MKPGQSVEEAYQDLLNRAEAYFKKLIEDRYREADVRRRADPNFDWQPPPGVTLWLNDLTVARMWDGIERWQQWQDFHLYESPEGETDVPL